MFFLGSHEKYSIAQGLIGNIHMFCVVSYVKVQGLSVFSFIFWDILQKKEFILEPFVAYD